MKLPSVYLKMRVLGAVDTVAGKTRDERMHAVAAMTFTDEDGHPRQFTWRTIQTWFYRYKNQGITGMTTRPRCDKGHTRKVTPEELLEAIHAAKPHFRSLNANKRAIYRFCVEKGLLHPDRIGRVAPGGCPPKAPTDPDVPHSGIRLLKSSVRCETEHGMDQHRSWQREPLQHLFELVPGQPARP